MKTHRNGFTLVEVLIATALAALTCSAFMVSIVYMTRESAQSREQFYALQVASAQQGLVRAANRNRIGDNHLGNDPDRLLPGEYEYRFVRTENDPLIIPNQPFNFNATISTTPNGYVARPEDFRVWFEFTGWGTVINSDANARTITCDIPANQRPWETNEWAGNYFQITDGFGIGQIFKIVSNTSNTVTVTTDLTGDTAGVPIPVPPNDTSSYRINNSRQIELNVAWRDGANHRRIRRVILMPVN